MISVTVEWDAEGRLLDLSDEFVRQINSGPHASKHAVKA
jgi:hypothetical protein